MANDLIFNILTVGSVVMLLKKIVLVVDLLLFHKFTDFPILLGDELIILL